MEAQGGQVLSWVRGEPAPALSPKGHFPFLRGPMLERRPVGVVLGCMLLTAACGVSGWPAASGGLVRVPVPHLATRSALSPCPLWALVSSLHREGRATICLKLCISGTR